MANNTYYPRDAYNTWARETDFRDFGDLAHLTPNDFIAVAIECIESVAQFLQSVKGQGWIQVPRCYYQAPSKHRYYQDSRFCTARVQKKSLHKLSKLVKRYELGLCPCPALTLLAANEQPQDRRLIRAHTVVAIIDDFVGFAHTDFWHKGRSRVKYVWHQDELAHDCVGTSSWSKCDALGYGYELRTDQDVIASRHDLERQYPKRVKAKTHGSHIASLAAGSVNHNADLPPLSYLTPRQHYQDNASGVPIIAIHLPRKTVQDGAGGSMCIHVIDALHYLLQRVHSDTNIVVNLSYATYAGPHDGSTLLEAAMDEWIKLNIDRHVIVLPSGNHYDARCHAQFSLSLASHTQQLNWQVPPDNNVASVVEIWATVKPGSSLSVTVTSPTGEKSDAVTHQSSDWFASGHAWGVMYRGMHGSDTKNSKHMALIALAPTAATSTKSPHGVWRIDVGYTGKIPTDTVHAWIERSVGMTGYGQRNKQSQFIDGHYNMSGHRPGSIDDAMGSTSVIKRANSCNAFANTGHDQVIVVGGYVAKTAGVAHYSGGSGIEVVLTRRPNVAAVSDASYTLLGIRGAATHGAGSFRMNGTSVATPLVTRWIANYLASPHSNPSNIAVELARVASSGTLQKQYKKINPTHNEIHRVGAGRLDPN